MNFNKNLNKYHNDYNFNKIGINIDCSDWSNSHQLTNYPRNELDEFEVLGQFLIVQACHLIISINLCEIKL